MAGAEELQEGTPRVCDSCQQEVTSYALLKVLTLITFTACSVCLEQAEDFRAVGAPNPLRALPSEVA